MTAPPLYSVLPFVGHAPRHRRVPALGPALVGVEPQQAARLRGPGPSRARLLRPPPSGRARAHGRGLRLVHRPARRPVRDLRRHPAARRPGGDARHQHRIPGPRRAPGVLRGDHGRLDAADPAPAADEQPAHARQAHRHLLHLHRVQRRRHADAAGRSAPVPRLSGRRAVRLDVPPLAAVGPDARGAPRGLLRLRLGAVLARAARGHPTRPPRDRAAARAGRAQRGLARGRRARRSPSCTRPGGRSPSWPWPPPRCGSRRGEIRRDNGFSAGPDGRSGGPVRRDFPDDDPGPRAAAAAGRRARRPRALAVLLGLRRRCRRSSTTRRPI